MKKTLLLAIIFFASAAWGYASNTQIHFVICDINGVCPTPNTGDNNQDTGDIDTGSVAEIPEVGFGGGSSPRAVDRNLFPLGSPDSENEATPDNSTIVGGEKMPLDADRELFNAYVRAKNNHIIAASGYSEIEMYEPLTRAQMAQLLSLFVAEVMRREIVPLPICETTRFLDAAEMTGDEHFFITQACNLGLMGWKNDKSGLIEYFKPHELMNRAQFATVISRLFFDKKHENTGSDRYKDHLQVMFDNGFIKKIDTPFMEERIGYMLIILQRIAEKYTKSL